MIKHTLLKIVITVIGASMFFVNCNHYDDAANIVNDQVVDITSAVSASGTSFNLDVFYSDPILTKQNNILLLGLNNKCILEFESELIFAYKTAQEEHKELTYCLPSTPSWLENGKLVQSITCDPETKDIYVLYNGVNLVSGSLPNITSRTANMEKQEIGIVIDSKLTKSIPVVSDNSLSKIRLYKNRQLKKTVLLATNNEGVLYTGTLTTQECKFIPIHTDVPELVSWDLAEDTLLGIDKESHIHLYKLSMDNNENIILEKKPESISYPFAKKMTNPVLQYNPATHCLILWDAVFNGQCLYALHEEDAWQWKQVDVSPMVVYPFSIMEKNANFPYEDASILFYCFGVKSTESDPHFYIVYGSANMN